MCLNGKKCLHLWPRMYFLTRKEDNHGKSVLYHAFLQKYYRNHEGRAEENLHEMVDGMGGCILVLHELPHTRIFLPSTAYPGATARGQRECHRTRPRRLYVVWNGRWRPVPRRWLRSGDLQQQNRRTGHHGERRNHLHSRRPDGTDMVRHSRGPLLYK